MRSLEAEYRQLHADGLLDDAALARAVALDRREAWSIHLELRLVTWIAVLCVTGGVGWLLARNLDRLGPATIVLGLLAAATACALPAIRARFGDRAPGTVVEYALLLGALLASAALAYAETQFRLLGPLWTWHLLLLAALHGTIAHALRSPLVLAAALTALAGWFGMTAPFGMPFGSGRSGFELGAAAIACAVVIVGWRTATIRLQPAAGFTETFDQFAANLAFWGALAWCVRGGWFMLPGVALLAAFATLALRRGLAHRRESYVVYAVVYSALGACVVLGGFALFGPLPLLAIVLGAAYVLWHLHGRIRDGTR
ncbi:MAG: DUF2157 domain-containing protein [Steroidobacteraceae bacterium]|jgi:hypothetical protein|nr:DUF2157 domain-containing protein [Steroidobacteraceae bacterium]